MGDTPQNLHATAIVVAGCGVLIRGPSGAGKSDLALRCLTLGHRPLLPEPVELVADDQVIIRREGNHVLFSAPQSIRGRLEVRGLGILTFPAVAEAELQLVVELVARSDVTRLPEPDVRAQILGCSMPLLRLHAFDACAPIKLLLAAAVPAQIGQA